MESCRQAQQSGHVPLRDAPKPGHRTGQGQSRKEVTWAFLVSLAVKCRRGFLHASRLEVSVVGECSIQVETTVRRRDASSGCYGLFML